jgi:hypothetical protein
MLAGTVESFQRLHGHTNGVWSGAMVVNDQVYGEGMVLPARSVAEIAAVNCTPRARVVVGVNVAVLVVEL